MDEMKTNVEKQDSLEVSRNQAGKHSFKQKRYYSADNTPVEQVIAEMKKTEMKLLEAFQDES